jgi:hypothetical protein
VKTNITKLAFLLFLVSWSSVAFGQSQTKVGHATGGVMVMDVSAGTMIAAFNNEFMYHDTTRADTITSVSLYYESGYYFHGIGHSTGVDTVGAFVPLTIDGSSNLYLSFADGTSVCSGNCCTCCRGLGCPCSGGVGTPPYSCKSKSVIACLGAGHLGFFY